MLYIKNSIESPISSKLYASYLDQALNTLFRSIKYNGFWDDGKNKLIRALNCRLVDGKLTWSPDTSVKWRYTSFALMGVMLWRDSNYSHSAYDKKIRTQLHYFIEMIKSEHILDLIPSYGTGPLILSFSLAYKIFHKKCYEEVAWNLYNRSITNDFNHSEDSLLLYGWCYLYQIKQDLNLRNKINMVLENIIKKQNNKKLFIFQNKATKKHQNQMYILWGVGKAIEVLNRKEFLVNMEKVLDYTIERRMLDNGAFIWIDPPFLKKMIFKIIYAVRNVTPSWHLLFECHQTFFVNAVFQYYRAGGSKDYNTYIFKAIDWIFGNNILGEDLVEKCGIGVPIRMMDINGNTSDRRERFKGAYEIGSYIMALQNLLEYDYTAKSMS